VRLSIIIILLNFFSLSTQCGWGDVKTISSKGMHEWDYSKSWTQPYKSEKAALKALVSMLAKSPSGKKLLLQAKNKVKGEPLFKYLFIGDHSLTDTTLVRRFSAGNPHQMRYETKSKVFVNCNLNARDAVLDLAHELTHFTKRSDFNPYDEKMGAKYFIEGTIAGRGGEVEAFLTECRVSFDLFPKSDHGKCDLVIDESSGRLSFSRAVNHFYSLGGHFKEMTRELAKHDLLPDNFVYMDRSEASFISSAYGVPYPLAAAFEFRTIMSKVCSNDKKRLSYMERGRGIASARQASVFKQKLEHRCSHFTEI